ASRSVTSPQLGGIPSPMCSLSPHRHSGCLPRKVRAPSSSSASIRPAILASDAPVLLACSAPASNSFRAPETNFFSAAEMAPELGSSPNMLSPPSPSRPVPACLIFGLSWLTFFPTARISSGLYARSVTDRPLSTPALQPGTRLTRQWFRDQL